ncbi:DMT family transporter [Marinospirillum alkaliphilum]|uniref:Permease of the drug/metabolite transporter (DMT) superfamily n=1 Tax=Marinospirillum alkaliphilum DSM 21637 TaxID=1122209 RepID=A0A1K1YXB2_9GAMM|nr:DMT family transporter [Marinospirillum alkaliphilum]SFX66512.1 Permease of the drug/metabolite transporter (DMT) superfamily [Marinospirillum alkaliphilum DSM 21637]
MTQSLLQFFASPWLVRVAPWLFVLLWSTGFISAKYGLPYSEPFAFLAWRMFFNLLCFALLLKLFAVSLPRSPRLWGQQLLAGALIHGAYLGGVFSAIEAGIPAGLTALLVGLQPLLTGFLVYLLWQQRLSLRQWLGLLLGLAGVLLVLQQTSGMDLEGITITWTGLGWVLLALLGITLGTVYQKNACDPQPLLAASFIQYAGCFVLMLVGVWIKDESAVEWHPDFILALAWSVLVLSVGAILLLLLMIRAGESTRTASYFYLVPPLTALEAWLLFDERMTLLALVGMIITVFGVYWANRAVRT